MKWTVELEGGEAFPANAATACYLAARGRLIDGTREVFGRLSSALVAARPSQGGSPEGTVTVGREDLVRILGYARTFDVDDDDAMIRVTAAVQSAGKVPAEGSPEFPAAVGRSDGN